MIVALCSAINLREQAPKTIRPQDNAALGANGHENQTLSFAERVAYQTAIEDVYWRHRVWPNTNPGPKPALDKVMSQADIEKKVTDYLRNSQALEDYWHRPITADQLQAEMERMARDTKQPGVLQDLFAALGNDPFVIAECLARPILVERLIGEFSSGAKDASFRAKSRNPAARLTADSTGSFDAAQDDIAANLRDVAYHLPVIASPSGGCTDDTWAATTLTNAPSPRTVPSVWTGTEMIVWGSGSNTGGRYNPSTDSWRFTSTINAPTARGSHTLVWTGSEMIVWGGSNTTERLNTGGRYNPMTDTWTATSLVNVPTARAGHTAVWTGSEMIVWGGDDAGVAPTTGGRYDPIADSWTATSITNVPHERVRHTAVWTGSEMIVWGGFFSGNPFNTGGRVQPYYRQLDTHKHDERSRRPTVLHGSVDRQ